MHRFYVAIDGGSSKSTGLLAQEDFHVISRASAGCANYHIVGVAGTEKTILTLIESLCSAAGVSPKEIEAFCFALSGVSRPRDFKSIEDLLRRQLLHRKSKVISDAEAALLGGTSKGEGIVIISGTGSVVFGRTASGKTMKIGGHGHLIGDPGSGYDIGIRALNAVIACAEGRAEKTSLTGRILDAIPLRAEDEIVPWLYALDDPKATVARLAPAVISTAEQGDAVASEILRAAAAQLADLAVFTAKQLGLADNPFDVVLCGGVFLNNPPYFHLMQSALSETMSTANPMRPENEPAFGALRALLGRPTSSPTGKPVERTSTQGD